MLTNLRLNKYAKNLLRYLLSKDGMNVFSQAEWSCSNLKNGLFWIHNAHVLIKTEKVVMKV